jgi:hypothetical protein
MLKYGAVLIGLYIATASGSQFGQVFTAGAAGGTQLIKGLQGR